MVYFNSLYPFFFRDFVEVFIPLEFRTEGKPGDWGDHNDTAKPGNRFQAV